MITGSDVETNPQQRVGPRYDACSQAMIRLSQARLTSVWLSDIDTLEESY